MANRKRFCLVWIEICQFIVKALMPVPASGRSLPEGILLPEVRNPSF